MSGFLPPAVLEIGVIAGEAIAKLKEVNAELAVMQAEAGGAAVAVSRLDKALMVGKAALIAFTVAAAAVGFMSVHAAMEVEDSYARLGQAMSNAGVLSEENRAKAEETFVAMEKLGIRKRGIRRCTWYVDHRHWQLQQVARSHVHGCRLRPV